MEALQLAPPGASHDTGKSTRAVRRTIRHRRRIPLSSTLEFANLGWVLFGISGVALAAMAYLIRAYWLLAMQLCFCWTNGRGIWNKVIGADSLPPELATKLQALVAWASSLLS